MDARQSPQGACGAGAGQANSSNSSAASHTLPLALFLCSELVEKVLRCRGASYFSVHSPAEFQRRLDEEFDFIVAPLVSTAGPVGRHGLACLHPRLERSRLPSAGRRPLRLGPPPLSDPCLSTHIPPQVFDLQLKVMGQQEGGEGSGEGSSAGGAGAGGASGGGGGGWRLTHVYGSPDGEERRLSGDGTVMRVRWAGAGGREEGISSRNQRSTPASA